MSPKTERVVLEARKAYRASKKYELDQLMAEQTRWQRKLTIATNKLQAVRDHIDEFLDRMVVADMKKEDKPQ